MKNIILGVTASVAAIKVLNLAESLKQFANVRIVMTKQSEYFIQSDFNALKELNIPIYSDEDEWPELDAPYQVGESILHIEMRRWADLFLVAPMDANTLAKIAGGLCDNLLTSIVRAWDWNKPMVLCPAMNTMMWNNPPTEKQLALLKRWGAVIIEPVEKKLACQDIGIGGMASVPDIVEIVKTSLYTG
jgi:phosphopantothenoylcysteine decarboxylase